MSKIGIDPLLSLTISMHSNPGVYALLLGSGVSRSAGIPTGWEVVLDLIKQVAAIEDEDCGADPEAWYTRKYKAEPTYSGLLDAVAKSQAERSQLLRGYFEPSDDDRENDRKAPTAAHHAIVRLVKSGCVRLILTTNFDRLMEQALEAAGISPTVIASPDAIEGAMPLVHSKCTLVKLHGDYLDIRTRNTPVELSAYDPRTDHLLDHILDEFGLVVCGWSGEWDTALRKAIERCKGRRFTTYWALMAGSASDAARDLMALRSAEQIETTGANEFFSQLAEKTEVLALVNRLHPLSVKVAIAQTKKYVFDHMCPIPFHDLMMDEVEQVIKTAWSSDYPVEGSCDDASVARRLGEFEALSETACAIAATGCLWSGGSFHYDLWVDALKRLGNPDRPHAWNERLQSLRSYPALLVYYAAGIGAVHGKNIGTVNAIFRQPQIRSSSNPETYPVGLFNAIKPDVFKVVENLKKMQIPRSLRLQEALRDPLRTIIPSDDDYVRAFDAFETLQSLHCSLFGRFAMPGVFMYRYYIMRGDKKVIRRDGSPLLEMNEDVSRLGASSAILRSGFLDGSTEHWTQAVQSVDDMTRACHF